jgi:hypothetical protein
VYDPAGQATQAVSGERSWSVEPAVQLTHSRVVVAVADAASNCPLVHGRACDAHVRSLVGVGATVSNSRTGSGRSNSGASAAHVRENVPWPLAMVPGKAVQLSWQRPL